MSDFEIPAKARKALEESGQLDLGVETPEPDDDRDNMGHTEIPWRPVERMVVTDYPSLSDPDETTLGKFHRDGHATERASAIDVYPRTGTQRRAVLDYLAAAGDRGATDRELQRNLGIRRARTRRDELVTGGWVINSGRTRQLDTHNDAIVWVLSDTAKAKL